MLKNYLKYTLITGMIITSLSADSQPPYLINKLVSENKIARFGNQKLLLLDFWATWCTPCAPATQQLEILQQTNSNNVFIVSVSDESEETILNYLQNNPIRLAVVEDYLPNSMVSLFNVQSRPYAVLLTLDGKILYKGHPANITPSMIEKYAKQAASMPQKNWNDLFSVLPNSVSPNVSPPKNNELFIVKQAQPEKKMYIDNGIFYYSGTLSGLIEYLTDCSSYQIVFQGMADYGVSMNCGESELLNSKPAILQLVEKRLAFTLQYGSKPTDAYILDVVNPKLLWDDKQIDWGGAINPAYIVGTDRIEADNLTLKEIANLLSDIKGQLFYYSGNDCSPHDWSFHYHYDDLMNEDLEDNFGIKIKKENINLPIYMLSPQ